MQLIVATGSENVKGWKINSLPTGPHFLFIMRKKMHENIYVKKLLKLVVAIFVLTKRVWICGTIFISHIWCVA